MKDIIFVHGMFQNPKSWTKWVDYFRQRGYNCLAPAWPLHEGEPADLRANAPEGLGKLTLDDVITAIEIQALKYEHPIVIGHSVGGLIAQLLIQRQVAATAVAISTVAPNMMMDFDWSFLKNATVIMNPLKGDEPIFTDPEMFHGSFANTLSEQETLVEFEKTATHDSRNVLRTCMGSTGHIDVDAVHAPLLLIAGEEDEIIPASLVEKNYKAYSDENSVTSFKAFAGRSHYICNEPGWEEVAEYVYNWLKQQETETESTATT